MEVSACSHCRKRGNEHEAPARAVGDAELFVSCSSAPKPTNRHGLRTKEELIVIRSLWDATWSYGSIVMYELRSNRGRNESWYTSTIAVLLKQPTHYSALQRDAASSWPMRTALQIYLVDCYEKGGRRFLSHGTLTTGHKWEVPARKRSEVDFVLWGTADYMLTPTKSSLPFVSFALMNRDAHLTGIAAPHPAQVEVASSLIGPARFVFVLCRYLTSATLCRVGRASFVSFAVHL